MNNFFRIGTTAVALLTSLPGFGQGQPAEVNFETKVLPLIKMDEALDKFVLSKFKFYYNSDGWCNDNLKGLPGDHITGPYETFATWEDGDRQITVKLVFKTKVIFIDNKRHASIRRNGKTINYLEMLDGIDVRPVLTTPGNEMPKEIGRQYSFSLLK